MVAAETRKSMKMPNFEGSFEALSIEALLVLVKKTAQSCIQHKGDGFLVDTVL